jgi:hypothetical protein
LTYRTGGAEDDSLWHVFVGPDGRAASESLIGELHLDDLAPLEDETKKLPKAKLERLVAAGGQLAAARAGEHETEGDMEPVAVTVVWCKYAQGKFRFAIGESTAELPFSGWAETLQAPPFVAPHSGTSGYHLGRTDDGQITLAQQIEVCAESGCRVLAGQLVECSVTGRRVLPEFVETCPVTGRPALGACMVDCPVCQQRLSPDALDAPGCQACQHMANVSKDDPRIARLLGEYPRLDRWRRWKLSETATVYVASAAGILRSLLLVVDKKSLQPLHLATGSRLVRRWMPIVPAHYDQMLS